MLYEDTALVFNGNMPTIKTSLTFPIHLFPFLHFPLAAMDTASPTTTSTATPLPDNQYPVVASTQHGSGSGSVASFFAVMSVIIVLLALSCVLGRLCGHRAEGPDSWYDCLGWCRRRCGHRHHPFAMGCGGGDRELRTVAVMDSDPKVGDSNQLSLPSHQP